MGACGMRNSPLVRTALLPSFRLLRSELASSLRAFCAKKPVFTGFQSRINDSATSALFCQAKRGEHQRSTPPQEPPIGLAASIRTWLPSRKPDRLDGLQTKGTEVPKRKLCESNF